MKIALRTQQIIAEETRVTDVVDPMGGSYYLESLTSDYEKKIFAIIDEVDKGGGTIKLIKEGFFQQHIADYAYETALRKADGKKPVIGVNTCVDKEEKFDVEIHPHDPTTEKRQIDRLKRVRKERDNAKVEALLNQLVEVAKDPRQNIMPVTIELVREGASMGDIIERLKLLWGTYRENPVY
jgi:2-hydroxyisobutanoyl-CoA mutase large subunit